MRTTTRSKSKVTVFIEKVFFTYRKIENFRHIAFLYIAIAIVIIGIALMAAQLNFANHRYEVDISVLPIEKQERFKYLEKKELSMYIREDMLLFDFRYGDLKKSKEKRAVMKKEMFAILAEAPYSSWGYKFYHAIGLVDNKNKKMAVMPKKG